MRNPFLAEHDQQQAAALDILRGAKAFILVHFSEEENCSNPFCDIDHPHHSTNIIASCGTRDLHAAMNALGEELLLATSVEVLMRLDAPQRELIAALLRDEQPFLRLADDEE